MFSRIHFLGFTALLAASICPVRAQHELGGSSPAHTTPADLAIKRFQVSPGLKVELFAAEPHLANPVAIHVDDTGRCFVVETHRLHKGVPDIRGRRGWPSKEVLRGLAPAAMETLDETLLVGDLALRTVEDRTRYFKKWKGAEVSSMEEASEALRLVVDTNGDGRADHSTVFATNFNTIADGIASGVISRGDKAWFANIPNLWLLEDSNKDGVADSRQTLHTGFGVRTGFLGHDLHGLIFGPDGRLYFSIGDRGAHVVTREGKVISTPDTGAVFRCDPDGSGLELFHGGLRNPQELAFDEFGNLFTGDNNSDGGDQARVVFLVEGGDSGWRIGWQFIEQPGARGPWNSEKMWHPQNLEQPAYIVPPITNITSGPSGFAYNPGTALGSGDAGRFYLVDFRGSAANSGVHSFRLKPRGASFELYDHERPLWSILATDACFGPDGALYVSDWIEGWGMSGKGRIYKMFDPARSPNAIVAETKALLASGMAGRSPGQLAAWMGHPDMRVRQAAQFEWVDRILAGPAQAEATRPLAALAANSENLMTRLHAVWALGQLARKGLAVLDPLVQRLDDPSDQVRSQAAKTLGDVAGTRGRSSIPRATSAKLAALLRDPNPSVRMNAALALGKAGHSSVAPALLELLRENADADPYLRHAAVTALTGLNAREALLASAGDTSPAVRMGVLLAMRRLEMSELAGFLQDKEPRIVLEAARAIHDKPMAKFEPRLASMLETVSDSVPLTRRVLGANFRQGKTSHAKALAQYAARSSALESLRVESLQLLASWPSPSQRDSVTGMWRALATRSPKTAADALAPHLKKLLQDVSMAVRIAAANAAGSLGMKESADLFAGILASPGEDARFRAAALRALAGMKSPRVGAAFVAAMKDPSEEVRLEAARVASKSGAEVFQPLMSMIETAGTAERQTALAALGKLPGEPADKALEDLMRRFSEGKVAPELGVELLEAAGARKPASSVQRRLETYLASLPKDDPMAEFQVALSGGNREAGQKIFAESETASCIRCHKVGGTGGEAAPALDGVGSRLSRELLLESIVLPNKVIAPGFENVTIVMKNGTAYAGVLKKESEHELELNSPEDGVVTVKKEAIKAREKGASGMLPDLARLLTKRELRDLIEYLTSLK